MPRTKGALEAEISQAVIRFEREFMGRGPLEARTYLIDDMVLVRLRGALTVPEQRLAARPDQGTRLIKQMRQELMTSKQPLLEELVQGMLGTRVRAVFTDISPCTGEGLIIMTLEQRPGVLDAALPVSTSPNSR
jgi:uncharacterized protein YbcI